MMIRRYLLAVAALALCGQAIADTYQCPKADGGVEYRDFPCRNPNDGRKIAVPNYGPERGTMTPDAKLNVTEALARDCFEGFRKMARDPTTAKFLSYFGQVGGDGFPYVYANAVFTNKMGGPNRRFVRCKLKADMSIDRAALDEQQTSFFRSEME